MEFVLGVELKNSCFILPKAPEWSWISDFDTTFVPSCLVLVKHDLRLPFFHHFWEIQGLEIFHFWILGSLYLKFVDDGALSVFSPFFIYIYFWNIFLAIYCCLIFLYHSILTVYLLYCIFMPDQIKCCLAELYFILMIYIPFLSCSSPTWNGSWNKSLVYKVCEELKTVTTWSMVSSQNGFWIPSKQRKVWRRYAMKTVNDIAVKV